MLASPRIAQLSWSDVPVPALMPGGWGSAGDPADLPAQRGPGDSLSRHDPSGPADRQARDLTTRTYEQHHAELYRAAMRACRNPETAEDLVQEAFLRLVREIAADRTPDNVRAWLHRVIANLAVSLGRRAATGQRFADVLAHHEQPVTPEAIVMDLERRSELASALRVLPGEARTALVLAATGFSGAEIAAAIGRSDCATRALMCRARLKLRDRLNEAEAGPEAVEARARAPRAREPRTREIRAREPRARALRASAHVVARVGAPAGGSPSLTTIQAL